MKGALMGSLDTDGLAEAHRSAGIWAASLLRALARKEAAGHHRPRLTEPRLDTWARFRGRLSSVDFVSLLFEDAAVSHRIPFDPNAIGLAASIDDLPETLTDGWLQAIDALGLKVGGADYLLEQAKLLALPTRLARSSLHVVKPHQKVLELPGTGGQLAHHLVSGQKDLTLQDNFVVACGSWQELTLTGIVGLELDAPHSNFVTRAEDTDLKSPDHPLRQRSFDFILGLHTDKGGLFRVEDQLAIWFPTAKVLLV